MWSALAAGGARVHDPPMRSGVAALLLVAFPPAARADAPPAPPIYMQVLPAAVSLVAWLPVEREKDQVVLDVRVEAVLPRGCGDALAGLMRRAGPTVEGPDEWDVVLERHPVGECKKEAVRVGARWPVRMRLPDGATRRLTIGERALQVARAGTKVTLDGAPPVGDLPGAPPTAAPASLVVGEVQAARVAGARRLDQETRSVTIHATVRWPKCAGAPLGWLGRGDAGSHFRINHFEPIARAPIDAGCRTKAVRETDLALSVHGEGADLTLGRIALKIDGDAPPAARK
jgi:hypothetical protein